MQEKVNEIIRNVCWVINECCAPCYYVCPETLFAEKNKNVPRGVSLARQISHYIMHNTLGYSVTFIARTTNTTRANVFTNVRKCRQLSELYPDYAEIKNKTENKIKETLL